MNKETLPKEELKVIEPPPKTAEATVQKDQRIRFRTFVVGLPLMVLAGFWIFGGEMGGAVQRYTFATWAAPFYNAVYILLILCLVNIFLRRYLRPISLNSLELLAIYAMVSVGSALISSDLQGILVTLMGYPTYFADDINNWNQLFSGVLPKWLMVTDKTSVMAMYKGHSSFWRPENYMPWLKPIAAWTLFIWALLLMMMCVNTILRKAWIERERLTFPIVALPMAMADDSESFFSNKLMWLGFAIAGTITLINGLNYLFPQFPEIPIKRVDYPIANSGPLLAMGNVRVCFYFFAITLGFLMPLDLSFSIYFFYILFKFEALLASLMGMPPESGFPYTTSQAFGAYIALFMLAIWGLRRHLATVWNVAFGQGDKSEDANEPMRYRSAIVWLGLSSIFLMLFSIAAGMKPIVAMLFLGIYLALSVMITRIRAEFGFPVHDMHEMGPGQTMVRMVGTEPFDKQTLGAFSVFYWFNRVYRSHPMPHQMEAMKMAGTGGRAQKSMFRAILIAGMIAVPLCFAIYLNGFYHYGAATANFNTWSTGYGKQTFGPLENWLKTPKSPEMGENLATMFGFGFALFLGMLRRSFVGFPFHPLAYAVSNSWGVQNLWLPIMIGSWCKWGVLRGTGLSGYRKAMMLFFGLMLGEFAVGCSWTIYGLLARVPTYDFWP